MSHEAPLFHVKKLACAYPGSSSKSLVINELIIPPGKLVFLLGSSGTGKSTLLETLGMMNNTVASGEIWFKPYPESPAVDIAALWKGTHEKEINELRKKHFSFIFQNTNLMENFTAYENVCLSGMIKGDKVQQDVLAGAKELMNKVKLPENEVGINTLANNLSGGQRQRLAFVRALNNGAGVLFGDEPTGNLDESNANELMSVIKSHLYGSRTAIIVSHDVNLAIRHADIIVVMTKDPLRGYGEVNVNNIFEREFWEYKTEHDLLAFRKHITDHFHSAIDAKADVDVKEDAEHVEKNLKRSYRKLFFNRESKILFGKKYSNLIILGAIFFFTFLSIGFANGSLKYLNEKMSSAFVNWISISVPSAFGTEEGLKTLREGIDNVSAMTEYNYSNVSEYHKSAEMFFDHNQKEDILALGRTVDVEVDSKLLQEDILNPKNFIAGRRLGFKGNNDIALIVTDEFLRDFGYAPDAQFVLYRVKLDDPITKEPQTEYVPIPIRAVVDQLDGKYYFLYTINFLYAIGNELRSENVFTVKGETKFIRAFIPANGSADVQSVNKSIQSLKSDHAMSDMEFEVLPDTFGYTPGYRIEFNFYPELANYKSIDSVWNIIYNADQFANYKSQIMRTYSFDRAIFDRTNLVPDQFSVFFKDLNKVDEFAKYVYRFNKSQSKQENTIQVDTIKVKEKKNFLFLSNVTLVISILLILFASASIGLFIYNLVKTHLNKVKMNLGTFKAIGLPNKESIRIYFGIILLFVLISSLSGLICSYGVGSLINQLLMLKVRSDDGMSFFVLESINTVIVFVIVLISSLFVSFRTIRRILSKSPGDLIYNR